MSYNEKRNQEIAEKIKKIHEEHPDMGYRRIRDELEKHHDIDVNDKRVLRICRKEYARKRYGGLPGTDGCHFSRIYK